MLVVEHHPEPAIGQDLVDNTFNCKQFSFAIILSCAFAGMRRIGHLVASWR